MNTVGFWWDKVEIIQISEVYERYDGANKTCKLNNTELFLKLFHIQCKKLETTTTTKKQQNLKNDKVKFCLNIDIRKEMEDSRLHAIECLKTDYVRKRSAEF